MQKAHTVISVINSLSIRYKYDCYDLYYALRRCISLPIEVAFEKFTRIEQDTEFLDKITEALNAYRTFSERDHVLVHQCLMNFRNLDARSGLKTEKVFDQHSML